MSSLSSTPSMLFSSSKSPQSPKVRKPSQSPELPQSSQLSESPQSSRSSRSSKTPPSMSGVYTAPFEVSPLSWEEALSRLKTQQKLGISPLLETVVDMLEELGRPQDFYDIIQIGGTNGKTSTSRYTAAFLRASATQREDKYDTSSAGVAASKFNRRQISVGLYTSPELIDMRERIEVDGMLVTREQFAEGIAFALAAGKRVNKRREAQAQELYDITEFDVLTVAALYLFACARVDVAVLEVGMGGRWDATTATDPCIVALTGVDFDHTRILGETKQEIAREKAAIIKRGQEVYLGEGILRDKEVMAIVQKRCKEQGIVPHQVSVPPEIREEFLKSTIPFYQMANIALAQALVAGYEQFFLERDERHAKNETEKRTRRQAGKQTETQREKHARRDWKDILEIAFRTPIPGRFEMVSKDPLHIVDAAHNPQSVRATLKVCALQNTPLNLLVAIFADKDTEQMVTYLCRHFDERAAIYVTQTMNTRCMEATDLGALFEKCGRAPAGVFSSTALAAEALKEEAYIALGSITLAGEIRALHQRP